MVRADGDALVMHVGERPYVVVGSGTRDLSAQILNLEAMKGMLQQLLPPPAQDSLDEFGAVEHRLPPAGADTFTVVAARGGDDIWIEIRRRRGAPAAAAAPASAPPSPTVADPVERPAATGTVHQAAEPVEEPATPEVAPVEPAVTPAPAASSDAAEAAGSNRGLAPVLQMTRTVRIEVPARPVASRASGIERLLRLASARAASALFVTSDSRPSIRVDGDIRPLEGEAAMSRAEVEAAVMELMPASAQEAVGRGEPTEWIADFGETGSVRCITFTDHRGPGVVFRLMATRAATAEQLGLPREVQALAAEPHGLVLVAGAPGTGKSTLLSALVDQVNRQRAGYVVTLERQIRFVHDNRLATVSQREVRGGGDEALAAARAALREDPDVLAVDDLASAQMVPLLLEAAAETLVLISISAPSTTEAVERFIELAPAGVRPVVQADLAVALRGAVAQMLLKKPGGGRVAALEVLLATPAVSRAIGDGFPGQLQVALDAGRKQGQVPLADAVAALVRSGAVEVAEALRKAPDRERLLASLKREGIDTSAVERLA